MIEQSRKESEANQRRMLKDFLELQVTEKKRRDLAERSQKLKDFDQLKRSLEYEARVQE